MTTATLPRFTVEASRIPSGPPERRGVPRDGVRLLAATPHGMVDARFHELGRFLGEGDLLVVNTSTTRPAALDGHGGSGEVVVHFSSPHAVRMKGASWIVELRRPDGEGPILDADQGRRIALTGGGQLRLRVPYAVGPGGEGVRLWVADPRVPGGDVPAHLHRHGRPITYGVHAPRWPLEDYQTVFARHPGSAEMPSAARPFSLALVADLVSRGVVLAPVQLHAGVSSPEVGEPPGRERYVVPPRTAELVTMTHAHGGRVIAVGTTVTRALETVAGPAGVVRPGRGWTDLVLGPERPAAVVDGLLTGWHEADASHLQLLAAVAGSRLVTAAYEHALAGAYEWHEFGDTCLLLP